MQLVTVQNNIIQLMSQFVVTIKGATAQNTTAHNVYAETILVPLLRLTYGWNDIHRLNTPDTPNFPAIDLADDTARISIQVTSTTTRAKVSDTIEKFVNHGLYQKYDRLIFYFLGDKPSFTKTFDDKVQDHFNFNPKRDFLDYTDILRHVNNFGITEAREVERILSQNFDSEEHYNLAQVPNVEIPTGHEKVFLNLLEVNFPEKLYIAHTSLDRKAIIKESKRWHRKLNNRSSARDVVRAALEQADMRFGVDWKCFEGKIVTFHDLSDPNIPLHHLIDAGTVETLTPKAFYNINVDHQNVFKSLLWRCMQQLLFRRDIQWQNEDKLFIFTSKDNDERKERWYGRNIAPRTVYKVIRKDDDPSQVWRHEHFGFRTSFKEFNDAWYLVIKPEWFASTDGYRKSRFSADFVDYKKRHEENQHVNTHVRFIAHFLSHHHATLFDEFHTTYPFLDFGDLISFDDAPSLDDDSFRPSKRKSDANGGNGTMPLFEQ